MKIIISPFDCHNHKHMVAEGDNAYGKWFNTYVSVSIPNESNFEWIQFDSGKLGIPSP